MAGVVHELRRDRAASRQLVFAVGLFVIGLLLFTWPFVRVPPLHLVPAFLHLLGAWALVLVGLAVMSHALGRRARKDRDA